MTTVHPKLAAALDGVTSPGFTANMCGFFAQMEVAEEEIAKACARHPEQADLIWHAAFKLTRPTAELMDTEWLYRAHVAELCDRIAAGEDTRPGTNAEVAIACSAASLVSPFHGAGAGLYARVFCRICPPELDNPWDDSGEHYEALHGAEIDSLERELRRKLTQKDRKTDTSETACDGEGHGNAPVLSCRFAEGSAAS